MYDQLAEDYDRFVDWDNRIKAELPFIEKILESVKTEADRQVNILDAACGTGMHALALVKKGYKVSGADQSSQMIEAARHNAEKTGQQIRFETAGFGTLTALFGEAQFDAILCLGNSLPHLLSESDLSAALADFFACLTADGLLLLQNRNFDAVMKDRNRWMPAQAFQEGEERRVFQRFYDFESDSLIRFNMVTLTSKGNSPWESRVTSTLLRPLCQKELIKAVKTAGFKRVCTFGNLMGESFNPQTSENLILISRK